MIDLALFAERDVALCERKHRIRSGRQIITVVVSRLPASAGIDADRDLLESPAEDNVKTIAVE